MGRRGGLLVAVALLTTWTLSPAVVGAEDGGTPVDDTVAPTTVPATSVPPTTTIVDALAEPDEPPLPPAGPAPEGGPRTLTVTPHEDLVHGQSVLLRGRGWPPHDRALGAAQCISGAPGIQGCGPVIYFTSDAAGNFREDFEVDVILETGIGTFDCRVDVCVIGANDRPSAPGARFVPLSFDPAGPDPVRRTVDVDPDSDLVDGQSVQVTGDDFEVIEPGFGGFAEIIQCRLPAANVDDDCDYGTEHGGQVDTNGHLDEAVQVEAVLRLPGGATHDCRTGGCVLAVRDYDESFAEAALAPLGFDPAGPLRPPPTLVADPATGLVDGDPIDVTGTGWDEDWLALLFCRAGATEVDDCSFDPFNDAQPDANGEFATRVTAKTILRLEDGTRLDCRVDACAVVAATDETLRRSVEAPLAFDPAAGLLDLSISVTPTSGLEDGDEVHVEGEGGRPGHEVVALQCVGRATDYRYCDLDSFAIIEVPGLEADPVGQAFAGDVKVRRVLHLDTGGTIDCSLTPCSLVVSEDAYFNVADRAALDFARVTRAVDPAAPIGATPTFTG